MLTFANVMHVYQTCVCKDIVFSSTSVSCFAIQLTCGSASNRDTNDIRTTQTTIEEIRLVS